jgi:hypothetical protein
MIGGSITASLHLSLIGHSASFFDCLAIQCPAISFLVMLDNRRGHRFTLCCLN